MVWHMSLNDIMMFLMFCLTCADQNCSKKIIFKMCSDFIVGLCHVLCDVSCGVVCGVACGDIFPMVRVIFV